MRKTTMRESLKPALEVQMAHSKLTKQRSLSGIRNRLKKHSIMKSIRLVSELEQISPRTLEWWWYEQKKKQVKAAEEVSRPVSEQVVESTPSPDSPPAPQEPPRPAQLDIDSGLLKCSRCNGQHIEEREGETFYCQICEVILLFEGFPTEKTSPYYPLGDLTWMA